MNMNKLMRPASLAVIGASDKQGMAGSASQSSIKGVIRDRVYYVNPKRDELNGKKCYHALSELPEVPDCMLLCTPAHTAAAYMEEAGKMGIGAAVVLASGFSEERSSSARALSDQLKEICLKYDIALCGPNCIGIVNGIDNVCVTANNDITMTMLEDDNRRGAGVIAQSGYISSGFNNPDCDHLAMVVSAGNSIICGLEDYMLYMAKEDRINCIAAYIEGITKPRILTEALRIAAKKRKPVIVLKAGSSSKGGFAAASHTGSLAGNHRLIESLFQKYGVITTENLEELVSTTRMFAVLDGRFPEKATLAGVNFSGGENTLCADTCDRFGIALPDFEDRTAQIIRTVVPPFATPANPLDATTSLFSETEKVETLFRAVSDDKNIGLILVGNDVGLQSEPKDLTCAAVLSALSAQNAVKPAVVVPSFEKARNSDVRKAFESARIPVLSTGISAYMAIRHLMDFITFDPESASLQPAIPDAEIIRGLPQRRVLSEKESKEIIRGAGVSIPEQALAQSEEDLTRISQQIPFPWVMKIDSEDIPHKTEAGGVRLGIENTDEAAIAFRQIQESCLAFHPDARINGVLIQEQLSPGQEILIGITCDELFGPFLLAGMGGTKAELFRDTALCPCPVNKKEALSMLRKLKIWPLFEGFRGAPPLDADALSDLMVTISEYAAAHKNDLAELDLNPVFVYEQGAVAVDALIIQKEKTEESHDKNPD